MDTTIKNFLELTTDIHRRTQTVKQSQRLHNKSQVSTKHLMTINEITYAINGAIFEVHRVLGPGFLEKVYENALIYEFRKRGLQAENQVPFDISYKGKIVGEYFADLVVANKVVVELKAVDQLTGLHEAQLLNYMKASGLKVGLLINFKGARAEIRRFVL